MQTWSNTSNVLWRVRIKQGFFDRDRVKKILEKTNSEALSLVGRDMQEAAKKAIGQTAPAKTKKFRRITGQGTLREFNGGLYRELPWGGGGTRAAGKPVRSWAPQRFMYRDIKYFFDFTTQSVVIGPSRSPWLNQLHEFGGSLRQTAMVIGEQAAQIAYQRRRSGRAYPRYNGRVDAGALVWADRRFRGYKNWERSEITRTATYPARPYMGSAQVRAKIAKVAERWRNRISAP